jgi:hypothetical protein
MGPRASLDALWKDMPLAPVRNRSQVLCRYHHSLVTIAGTTLPSICENENYGGESRNHIVLLTVTNRYLENDKTRFYTDSLTL